MDVPIILRKITEIAPDHSKSKGINTHALSTCTKTDSKEQLDLNTTNKIEPTNQDAVYEMMLLSFANKY